MLALYMNRQGSKDIIDFKLLIFPCGVTLLLKLYPA